MTPTNNDILASLNATLAAASLGYAIAWPGPYGQDAAGDILDPFEPPTGKQDVWLQVDFFPNQGIDNGLAPTDGVVPQGNYQVEVFGRPYAGLQKLQTVANEVKALYPKNATISGLVRVQRHPYSMNPQYQSDRMSIVVTIPYTG